MLAMVYGRLNHLKNHHIVSSACELLFGSITDSHLAYTLFDHAANISKNKYIALKRSHHNVMPVSTDGFLHWTPAS